MKELVILRHAKSNKAYSVDDFNRPLSPAGIERIQKMSHQKNGFFAKADIIFSSPAVRALNTAMIVVRELNLPIEKLKIDNSLYTFSGSSIIDYVYALDDQWSKVVLVGHNPAFTELINHFSDLSINHLRTAGIAQITFDGDQWSDVDKGVVVLGQKNNNI